MTRQLGTKFSPWQALLRLWFQEAGDSGPGPPNTAWPGESLGFGFPFLEEWIWAPSADGPPTFSPIAPSQAVPPPA